MFGTWNIIDGLESRWSEHTVAIDTKIRIADHPELNTNELTYKNVFSTSGSPGFAAFRALNSMQNLMLNPFSRLKVEDITVDVKIKDKRNTAIIEGLRIEKDEYQRSKTPAEMNCLLSGRVLSEAPNSNLLGNASFSPTSTELSRSVLCPHEFSKQGCFAEPMF